MSRTKRILMLLLVMVMLCSFMPIGLAYAAGKYDTDIKNPGEINTPGEDSRIEDPWSQRKQRETEKLEASERPAETEQPSSTAEPASTDELAPTETPDSTKEPISTEAFLPTEDHYDVEQTDGTEDCGVEEFCTLSEGCILPEGHENECQFEEGMVGPFEYILERPWLIALSITVLALVAMGIILLLKARIPLSAFEDRLITVRINKSDISSSQSDTPIMMGAFRALGDRVQQQDYFIYDSTPRNEEVGSLAVVCDGMGGMQGGEIASITCAELIMQSYYQVGTTDDICELLSHLALEADKKVYALTDDKGEKMESGTTLVCVSIFKDMAYWISVGDSRIYLYQNGQLHQLTRDHNFRIVLQQQCDDGFITQEEVDSCPDGAALISYIGKGNDLLIDRGKLSFGTESDGILILCSDGLYKGLSDHEIVQIVSQNLHNTEVLPKLLVEAALAADTGYKKDNTTVLCISRYT